MPNLIPTLILTTIWCGSFLLAAIPYVFVGQESTMYQLAALFFAPIIFVVSFPTIAGLISRFGQKGIRAGKFPREAMHPVYLLRRIYGTAWTQVYYFKPLYAAVLAIPFFKKYVMRLFGYEGPVDFIVYPDTWIRDLPILEIGRGAYLSNRATIGTNICLADGHIFVSPVKVRDKGLVGHLAMLAPGATIGAEAEIGVGCAIGIKVRIKEKASIKPTTSVNHGAIIGVGADIGAGSFLGMRCEIGDGIVLPPGSNIPAGTVLVSQDEVDRFYSSETKKLRNHLDLVTNIVTQHALNE